MTVMVSRGRAGDEVLWWPSCRKACGGEGCPANGPSGSSVGVETHVGPARSATVTALRTACAGPGRPPAGATWYTSTTSPDTAMTPDQRLWKSGSDLGRTTVPCPGVG